MSARKAPAGARATRKRTPIRREVEEPPLVAGPVDETECLVTGCAKAPEQFGLCTGHYASRRGDGHKEVGHE